jgi:hypothetical protein
MFIAKKTKNLRTSQQFWHLELICLHQEHQHTHTPECTVQNKRLTFPYSAHVNKLKPLITDTLIKEHLQQRTEILIPESPQLYFNK